MKQVIRGIQTYLIFALPFILVCMALGTLRPEKEILAGAGFMTKAAWEILSWNLMIWFAVLIVFLVLLVASSQAREKTLARLANLKERDEREQQITGRASRAAYISTLSLMIFLLFFSIFSLRIYRIPESQAANGKTGTAEIGLGFSLLDSPRVETDSANRMIFETKDIPLSKTAIILILMLWQIGIFNYTARKENAEA